MMLHVPRPLASAAASSTTLCRPYRRFTSFRSTSRSGGGSVIRLDEVTGTWVVFASGRRDRPLQTSFDASALRNTKLADLPTHLDGCPFCAGNEHMTPNTLLTVGDSGTRVVPNKYPAVGSIPTSAGDDSDRSIKSIRGGNHAPFTDQYLLNNEIPAVGFHEVVIESPHHNAHIATASVDHARSLLTAFRDRGRTHRETRDIEHTVYFKNHGATAGASLVHPHSQIVSTPVVPVEAQRLQTLALEYFRKNRCSLYEMICEEELALYNRGDSGECRVVDMSRNFIAAVPYASAGPYTIVILPRFSGSGAEQDGGVDCSDFTTTPDDFVDECAHLLRSCMVRLNTLLGEPCFNLVVQTAPVPNRGVQASVQASAFFRWHIRITPRLGAGAMAGFELGSGFFSNSHMPEDDAAELRAVR
eukprot:CAMPEP_0178612720 /NCGR_PEP_ID=MMETSP0698-20121128/1273_1 /TAXON_ID=265572 /ORGANISM="Extubocellulus spinifer, Strain CCMP396" /LENGTH=415 /DNA_ID=CAMNT_0020251391 /DNA_START=90 /DNA_END=1338 /DNA_ORIENTATION=-